MSSPSSQERRAHFEEHGWIVVRGVLDGERLEAVEAAFDAMLAPYRAPDAGVGQRIWQLPGAGRYHGALLSHLFGDLGAIVADVLGAVELRLLQDTLIVKPPRTGAPVELHQDYTYTGFIEPPRSGSVRLALKAERIEDGCLYVVDGSHRWGIRGQYAPFTDQLQAVAIESLTDEMRERVEAERRPIELEPGDVSVHHCLAFHGSFENVGEGTRKTIVAHVFDGACRLLHERLPPSALAHFETDDDGHLIGDTFPILHSVERA